MSAETPSIPAAGNNAAAARQTLAFVTFGVVYYVLAAFAVSLSIQSHFPLAIWPAHGMVLGVLLLAPARRWGAYLALAAIATLAVGLELDTGWQSALEGIAVSVALPAVVAVGLLRLAGPGVEIGTV